jgi:uncharacterized protein YndB with AHSA1/START domain
VFVRGEVLVAAPREVTWDALADIATHVDWMADADTITFTTAQHRASARRSSAAPRSAR